MRIAVFTNQFPSQLNTFFARDMRSLIEAGLDIDVFPIYPLNSDYWSNIPEILNENIFPRSRIHHINILESFQGPLGHSAINTSGIYKDFLAISADAINFGISPLGKSIFSIIKGRGWAYRIQEKFDHILSYWGNYAATSAYVFHRISNQTIPFSMFLHAGTDLYRDQVFLEKKLLYADNIFVVCNFNYHFIQQLYPDSFNLISPKIHLHHLGLDFKEFPFNIENRQPNMIIGVGALTKLKGFDYLVRAVHQLINKGIDVALTLIGDGEERQALESLAHDLGVSSHINFLGWQSFDKVKKMMSNATLLVHPSSDIGDAVPTVIKEAMALGTPVVASDVAGIPELLDQGRCGVLVPPRNVDVLASAIQGILENNSFRINLSISARHFAEYKFDLWKNGKVLADSLFSSRRISK